MSQTNWFPLLCVLIGSGCAGSAPAGGPGKEEYLSLVISELESLRQAESREEQPAYESAIDALRRLRDHRNWPTVNTPVEHGYFEGVWRREDRTDGYNEDLHFGPQSSGEWDRDQGAIPISFVWLIEGRHLKLTTQDTYKEPFNYQLLEKTYEYHRNGDRLTLERSGEILQLTRVAK